MRILVTGAEGAIGKRLISALEEEHDVYGTDVDTMDVTVESEVEQAMLKFKPDKVIHLAGSKIAVEGELNPEGFARVNVSGTANVVRSASFVGASVVFSSTCKAADPETAYGASKLIAERIVLNADGVVVRFYNVPESPGNVFRLWESLPAEDPIPYTDCWRYFITLERAVSILVRALELPSGRYAPAPVRAFHMRDVAQMAYPERKLVEISRRRGDRVREPLHGHCEYAYELEDGIFQIVGAHDPMKVTA